MKPLTPVFLFAAVLLVSGCAAEKQYTLTGKDAEQGTVSVSYEYNVFQRPKIRDEQGDRLAGDTCAAMGYERVKIPPKQQAKCKKSSSNGDCSVTRVTNTYQCVGGHAGRYQAEQKALSKAAAARQLTESTRYLYYAEQVARQDGCPTALRTESLTPAKEVYSTVCRGRKVFITCAGTNCSSQ